MNAPRTLLILAAVVLMSCGGEPDGASQDAAVVDSVFPMDVMLSRFREGVVTVDSIEGGAESRDALVKRVVRALELQDTTSLGEMALDLAGFAWLYYPTASSAQPPYELPPGMAWLQLQEMNRKGVFRALEHFGGRRLTYQQHICAEEPVLEGENRIWTGCQVTLSIDGAAPAPVRLFSSILERHGRFVVLSWANDF